MKVSKKILIYIAIGAYVIVLASFGYVTSQTLSEKTKVEEELAVAQANLERANPERLTKQKTDLEGQLAQVTGQYEALKDIFSQPIGNVAASSIVFDIAEAKGVEVIELTTPEASVDSLENVTCSVVALNTTVEGDERDLVAFITSLNSYLTTGVIKSIDMVIPEPGSTAEPTATVQLVIYSYQGE